MRCLHGARGWCPGDGLPYQARRRSGQAGHHDRGARVRWRVHPVQQALAQAPASQCGYCTPGMALRAAALLTADPNPTDGQIRAALEPKVCRCGCYPRIARAVRQVAALLRGPAQQVPEPAPRDGPPLAQPRRPWDLCQPSEREWFDILGDGLVVVWPAPASAAPDVAARRQRMGARGPVRSGDGVHRARWMWGWTIRSRSGC